ncbi:MAG: cobalamin biosynthesis protein CobW [Synechococcaceae cyanobacterium SM2_3_2]|nr:cobalamin biosynthesis protein CobW [Synechococcaceae cyanobacterium SM2_3_2]
MHKIPVTIITGFLGVGKTTLVRHLLQHNNGRRIAVIVNEFGEVGIDGELLRSCGVCDEDGIPIPDSQHPNIVELANGCLCCTVQEEFLPTMQALLQRRDQLDAILIETSGLALPKPLVQAFRWPEIRTGATVDGILTVVDCQALASGQMVGDLEALTSQRQADPNLEHDTPLEELFEDQLNCADLVLLTKVDQVDPAVRTQVENWLKTQLAPGVGILACTQGQMDPEILLGFNAAVEDALDQRPSHHDHEEDHDHDEAISSVYVELDQSFDPATLIQSLRELAQAQTIYRIKGFVSVPQKSMRLVLQGVGSRFETFYDRPWQPGEPRQTRLVLIGQDLDETGIRRVLDAQVCLSA